jgi:hypothetical protein
MQFSVWKDRFADKDVLYHVYLAPFCRNAAEPLPGAKAGTLVLFVVVLAGFYVLLRRWKVPWPVLWVALLAFGSPLFLNRMLMIRSHTFSVAVMLLSAYVILKGRFWPCAAVGFLYAWSYSFPLAIVISAAAAVCGRFVLLGRAHAQPQVVLGSAVGVLAGLALHPYTPYSFDTLLVLLKITRSAAFGQSVELGSEFRGLDLLNLATSVAVPALLFLLAAGPTLSLWRKKNGSLSSESAAAVGMAGAWLCGMFVSARLVEYFAPLALLAAALVARDWLAAWGGALKLSRAAKLACAGAAVLLVAGAHQWSLLLVRAQLHSTRSFYASDEAWRRGRYFEGAADWLRQNVPPSATILNFHWDDFPELYYDAPQYYYVVGLDPTFLEHSYPEHAAALEAMRTHKRPLDPAALHKLFGSEYMVVRTYRAAKYPELQRPEWRPVYADEGAAVYRLTPGSR